jgi:threonine/homoserine/homoserine lactone efflux protein
VLAFLAVAALLIVTPGPDMAMITKNALTGGRRDAFLCSFGICTGLVVWAFATAVGVAALVAASATAFAVLKVVGAAYLVVLGLRTLWRSRHTGALEAAPTSSRRAYREGLLSNLLNPKVAVFYTTFLPQFVEPGQPVLVRSLMLAGLHIAMSVVWLAAFASAVARAGHVLRRPRVRRVLERLTGTALVALGLRLATAKR